MKKSIIIEKNITLIDLLMGIGCILLSIIFTGIVIGLIGGYFFLIYTITQLINQQLFGSESNFIIVMMLGVLVFFALSLMLIIISHIITGIIEFRGEKKYLPLKESLDKKTCELIKVKLQYWLETKESIYIDEKYTDQIELSEIITKLECCCEFTHKEIKFINDIFYYNRPTINIILFKIKFMGVYSDYQV